MVKVWSNVYNNERYCLSLHFISTSRALTFYAAPWGASNDNYRFPYQYHHENDLPWVLKPARGGHADRNQWTESPLKAWDPKLIVKCV